MPEHKLALRLYDESQFTVKCALLPVSRGFTAFREQLDVCVVAVLKFGRLTAFRPPRATAEVGARAPSAATVARAIIVLLARQKT